MAFFKRPSQAFRFEWEGQQLEIVDEFKYLGILFTKDGKMKVRVRA